jgi:hypothetical protein
VRPTVRTHECHTHECHTTSTNLNVTPNAERPAGDSAILGWQERRAAFACLAWAGTREVLSARGWCVLAPKSETRCVSIESRFFLIKHTGTAATDSNWSKRGLGLLLLSLGAACSSSDTAGGGPSSDGGESTDAGGGADRALMGDATDAATGATGPDGGDATSSGASGAVNLRSAGNYAILAESAVSNVPTSAVTGDVAVSPAAASYITGLPLSPDATNVFSTSPQVTGQVFAADYAAPTPSNLTTAVSDMLLAFADAAKRTPGVTELGAGNIGGMTLTPGVYAWSTSLLIPTSITLTGSATDVWVFQVAGDLTLSAATNVVLAGGAVAQNIFWEVAGAADLGTTSHFAGVILCKTAIVLETGAAINGRLMAQTAVSIAGSTVVAP